MSENNPVEKLCNWIVRGINDEIEGIPSDKQVIEEATKYREIFSNHIKVTDEEFERVKAKVKSKVVHTVEEFYSIKGEDGYHQRGW